MAFSLEREDADLNQYWYSPASIATLTEAAGAAHGGATAFLSTPSLFFAVPPHERAARGHVLFDFDETLGTRGDGVVRYDFRQPTSE